jgi:hypothetical protein
MAIGQPPAQAQVFQQSSAAAATSSPGPAPRPTGHRTSTPRRPRGSRPRLLAKLRTSASRLRLRLRLAKRCSRPLAARNQRCAGSCQWRRTRQNQGIAENGGRMAAGRWHSARRQGRRPERRQCAEAGWSRTCRRRRGRSWEAALLPSALRRRSPQSRRPQRRRRGRVDRGPQQRSSCCSHRRLCSGSAGPRGPRARPRGRATGHRRAAAS